MQWRQLTSFPLCNTLQAMELLVNEIARGNDEDIPTSIQVAIEVSDQFNYWLCGLNFVTHREDGWAILIGRW